MFKKLTKKIAENYIKNLSADDIINFVMSIVKTKGAEIAKKLLEKLKEKTEA